MTLLGQRQELVQTTSDDAATEALAQLEREVCRLDFGDSIPVHRIETLCGVTRGTEAYRIACLRVKNRIESAFLRRDVPIEVIIKIDADLGVYVLTPTEASYAGERRGQIARKKQRKALQQIVSQPRGMIDPGRLAEHDRAIEVNGRVVQAMEREVRRRAAPPAPRPVRRSTPTRR